MCAVVVLLLALLGGGCSHGAAPAEPAPRPPPPGPRLTDEAACNQNDASACNDLGMAYSVGFGVVQDDARAAALFQKACELGNGFGCYNFAYATDDRTVRRARLQKGCDRSYGKSCGALAFDLTLWNAEPARALQLYQRACDLGVGDSCFTLAGHYENGRLGIKDASRAAKLYVRACDLEWMEACFLLGNQRVANDRVAAIQLFTKACGTLPSHKVDLEKMPSGPACVALAAIVEPAKARTLLARACEFGAEVGCMQLVRRLQTGSDGLAVDPANALELLKYTCDRRTSHIGTALFIGQACDEAGMLLRARDPAGAAKLFQAACEPIYKLPDWKFGDEFVADAVACNHLARAYTRGEGLAKDATLAAAARRTSCQLEFKPACDYIRCSITLGCTPVDP